METQNISKGKFLWKYDIRAIKYPNKLSLCHIEWKKTLKIYLLSVLFLLYWRWDLRKWIQQRVRFHVSVLDQLSKFANNFLKFTNFVFCYHIINKMEIIFNLRDINKSFFFTYLFIFRLKWKTLIINPIGMPVIWLVIMRG